MLRVFFFFATFGEALSQTAQAFIPGQLARERSIKSAKKAARAAAAAVAGDAAAAEDSSADPRLSPARTMMRYGGMSFLFFTDGSLARLLPGVEGVVRIPRRTHFQAESNHFDKPLLTSLKVFDF